MDLETQFKQNPQLSLNSHLNKRITDTGGVKPIDLAKYIITSWLVNIDNVKNIAPMWRAYYTLCDIGELDISNLMLSVAKVLLDEGIPCKINYLFMSTDNLYGYPNLNVIFSNKECDKYWVDKITNNMVINNAKCKRTYT